MSGHFVEQCDLGYTHSQCRCYSPNKTVKIIECPTPERHYKYEPKHRKEIND